MATVGFADLVRLIEINGLLGERQLEQLRQQADKAIDPKVLLKKLLEKDKITRWQAQQLMQGNERLKIGNMILTEEISESNLGQLYHARQIGLDRPICVLVLSDEFQQDEDLLARFGERVGRFSSIHHDALVRPLEMEQEDDQVVVAMDHFSGEDLFDRIKEHGPLSKHETVDLVQSLVGLIDALHETDEVHGELTPGSIIFDDEDQERVLCFDPTPSDDAEKSENVEYFVSPDAQESEDPSIDLYSIGRIGLFAMTGDYPDEEYIQEHKSPLVTLFSRMSAEDDSQITSTAKVNKLLDRWLELNVEQETEQESSDATALDDSIGISSEDYQTDGDAIGTLNFGPDFAQSKIQERLKKSRGSASTIVAGAADADTDETKVPEYDELPQKKSSKGLLIGLGVGALALVLLCSGLATGVWYALSTAKNKVDEMALNIEDAVNEANEKSNTTDAKEDASSDDADDEKKKSSSTLAVSNLDPKSKGNGETDESKAGDETKQVDEGKKEDKKGPANVDPKNAATDPKNPADPKDKPDTKKEDPKVAGTDTKKPDDKKAVKPPPKTAKKVFELPGLLKIPVPGSTAEPGKDFGQKVTLGKVRLQPGEYFAINIHGGDYAHTETSKFLLKEIAAEQRSWQVRFVPNTKNEATSQVLADFVLEGEDLKFQWRDEALKVPAAASFLNCMAVFKTGTELQFASMRKPVKLEPIVLNEKTLLGKTDIKIENLPEMDFVKVEIMNPGQKFPEHSFNPGNVISAVKGETILSLGKASHEFFATEIKSRGRDKISISASSLILLKGESKKPLGGDKLKAELANWQNVKKQSQHVLEEYKKLKDPERRKDTNLRIKQRADLGMNHSNENILRLTELTKAMPVLQNGKLPVRIFFQAGDYQVDLATPSGNPVKKANSK